ncbi:MAG: rhodanese-like domain-containing protein [Desulfobulbaceae bacterium]|nr:rhodanese-like domain-containing protein [Desulfobulbaceae bacterium]
MTKTFAKLSVLLFLAIFLSWGCAQKGEQTTSTDASKKEAVKKQPVLKGKVLGVSNQANTISIQTGKGEKTKTHLVKFDKKTPGIEHAKKGHAAIIAYEMRNGQPHALSIKPKLAKLPVGVTEIKPAELHKMFDSSTKFTLVDARPAKAYAQSHVQNALSIPADEMKEKGAETLGNDKESLVIFYCGGPTCGLSTKAADIAKKMGYKNIRVMLAGEPGWRKAGHPTYATKAFIAKGNIVLIDLRDKKDSQAERIIRSVTIPYSNLQDSIEDIPVKAPIVLYSDDEGDMMSALKQLRKAKFKKVSLVSGGIEGWKKAGGTLTSGPISSDIDWKRKMGKGEVSVADFTKAVSENEAGIIILDVRSNDEAQIGKFKTATHIALDELSSRINELPKDKKIYVYCNTGARAEMANKELKKNGFNSYFLVAEVECEGVECDIED